MEILILIDFDRDATHSGLIKFSFSRNEFKLNFSWFTREVGEWKGGLDNGNICVIKTVNHYY